LSDARSFLKFASDNDADGVRFCGFVPAGRGHRDSVRNQLEFRDDLSELRDFVDFALLNRGLMIMFDPAFGPLPPDYSYHQCVAGVQTMYISSTGMVYPCTSLISKRFEVGNIRETSLSDIWNDPRMTEVSDLAGKAVDGRCNTCDHLSECHGGCRGIAFANTDSLSAEFPNCLYQFEVSGVKHN
jgi:radical SAM protein with 4Fe4S-binding SPASM domain